MAWKRWLRCRGWGRPVDGADPRRFPDAERRTRRKWIASGRWSIPGCTGTFASATTKCSAKVAGRGGRTSWSPLMLFSNNFRSFIGPLPPLPALPASLFRIPPASVCHQLVANTKLRRNQLQLKIKVHHRHVHLHVATTSKNNPPFKADKGQFDVILSARSDIIQLVINRHQT